MVLPGPAAALSCMRYDPVSAFHEADESAKRYMVVRGALSFDAEGLPESYDEDAPEEWLTNGRVVGKSLAADGFLNDFAEDIVVVVSCLGPWCGMPQASDDALMFLRVEADGAAIYLDVDPCMPHHFAEASEADFEAMEACMAGDCPPVAQ